MENNDTNAGTNTYNEIDLIEILMLLRRHWWQMILCAVLLAGIAFGYTKFFVSPKYQSTTKIAILNKTNEASISYSDIQISNQLVNDSLQIIKNREVLENVINELKLGISPSALSGKIAVSSPSNTRIILITITDTDPERAKLIAETIYKYASESIISTLDAYAVNMFEKPIVNKNPISPSIPKNCLIGALIGIVLYAGILILLHVINTKITTPDDVENRLGLTLLATIPYNEAIDSRKTQKAQRVKEVRKEVKS